MSANDLATILGLLKVAEDAYVLAANAMENSKKAGDPLPEEVTAQLARAQAAHDRAHALAT